MLGLPAFASALATGREEIRGLDYDPNGAGCLSVPPALPPAPSPVRVLRCTRAVRDHTFRTDIDARADIARAIGSVTV